LSEKEKRRHHASSGRGKRLMTRLAWAVVVLLLGGNLVLAVVNRREETPQGFVTPIMVQSVGFWLPVAVAAVFAVCGVVWATKAFRHSERTSLLWARRAHWFSLFAAVALTFACFERDVFPREWFAVAASVLLGTQTVLASMISLKEWKRSETGEGSRRARAKPGAPGALLSSETAGPGESPGVGR
jgi:hypothetical protein